MAKKVNLRPLPKRAVKIFKIVNRRGYAAVCLLNLTEGSSPYLAYYRMQKAVKRKGWMLPDLNVDQAKTLVRQGI
jgi:hypothetical protein